MFGLVSIIENLRKLTIIWYFLQPLLEIFLPLLFETSYENSFIGIFIEFA